MEFVRLYTLDTEGRGQIASWLMPVNEVKGLSIEQIASKYALPQLPTHMTDVLVPAGSSLRVTVANDISIFPGKSLGGNGGGGGVPAAGVDDKKKMLAAPKPKRPLKNL